MNILNSYRDPRIIGFEMTSKIFSIAELTRRIRFALVKSIGFVWVEGEISNLTYHPSGHVYFTLKDEQAQLAAVLFRTEAARLRFRLKDGMLVQGYGRVTVYERRGSYQIVLETVQPAGVGNLQIAFEALKKKLEREGLFDFSRKRALPIFPKTVAVVTSPNGAAIRDFCRVLHRRFSGVRVVIAPARVQGIGAAQEIAAAIDLLNMAEASGLDVCIDVIALIRGGGSLEDLWSFNEEVVARTVARSRIPTISGVGHEVDFTICDFVADVRAATPSAAAEMLIRSKSEFVSQVLDFHRGLQRCTRLAVSVLRHQLTEIREVLRLHEPRQLIREMRQRLDELSDSLRSETNRSINIRRREWVKITQKFLATSPRFMIQQKKCALVGAQNRFQQSPATLLRDLRHRLEVEKQRLNLLSPQGILARGYSITLDAKTGSVIRSAKSVCPEQVLTTKLVDGDVQSVIS